MVVERGGYAASRTSMDLPISQLVLRTAESARGPIVRRVRVPLALLTGLLIGFILPPAAAHLFKAHMGFSLYNMGYTAGIVGTVVVAMYKAYGFVPDPVFIWTNGNNLLLSTFLGVLFGSMLVIGVMALRHFRAKEPVPVGEGGGMSGDAARPRGGRSSPASWP